MPVYRFEDLTKFAARYFVRMGVHPEDAQVAANVLAAADLHGVPAQGLAQLDAYYGSRIRQGMIDPATPLRIITESPTTLALDAGNGLGPVAAYQAMKRCIQKAGESGFAIVAVGNNNHCGLAAYYAMLALEHNLLGISSSQIQPPAAPAPEAGPARGMVMALPGGQPQPLVMDMAAGDIRGLPAVEGVLDEFFGDALWAGMPGAAQGQEGHCFAASRVGADYQPGQLMRQLEGTGEPSRQKACVHSAEEFENAERWRRSGLPLAESTVEALRQAAQQAGVAFDLVALA